MKLFHSYQYIPNSKNIVIDKYNILRYTTGEFILGLLGVPDIKELKIVIEKQLVMKRLSKKSSYKNHTKHNIQIFIEFTKPNLDLFLKHSSPCDIQVFFKLLKKNYLSYNLNSNIYDILCVKQSSNLTVHKNLEINKTLEIPINNYYFDLLNTKWSHQYNNVKETVGINGGIILFNINDPIERFINLEMLNLSKEKSVFIFNNNSYSNLFKLKLTSLNNKSINMNQKYKFINLQSDHKENMKKDIKKDKEQKINVEIDEFKPKNIFVFDTTILQYVSLKKRNVWLISNSIRIIEITKFLNCIHTINPNYFLNINNLHQLSKVITPISHPLNIKTMMTNNILLNSSLKNMITCSSNILVNSSKKNEQCPICFENHSTFLKFKCGHIVCLECFCGINDYNNTNNIICSTCTKKINNTPVKLYLAKQHFYIGCDEISVFLKKINSYLCKYPYSDIALCNNKKMNNFLEQLIKLLIPNKKLNKYSSYSDILSIKDQLIITDYKDCTKLNNSNILILK